MPIIDTREETRRMSADVPPATDPKPAEDAELKQVSGGAYLTPPHDEMNPFVVNKVATIHELADADLRQAAGGQYAHPPLCEPNPLVVNK